MTERRYDDAEAAAIFERAAEGALVQHQTTGDAREGMTLAELQSIGREVGIPPESIALAAREVASGTAPGSAPPARRYMGLPIGVGRVVQLDRRLTDDEWERIVVDLRETFEARGTMGREGSLRQWTNGALQVLVEPTATGDRVRLRTTKSDARGMLVGGLGMMATALGITALNLAQGGFPDMGAAMAVGFLGLFGGGMFGSSALRLPSWARTRQRQMDEVAARIAQMTARSLPGVSASEDSELRQLP